MAKFPVVYREVFEKTFIVEASSYDEAEEKLRKKVAEDFEGKIFTDGNDFDHWETDMSCFGRKEVPENIVEDYVEV